ncbi:MAG: hypothetical protein JW801_16880 [Bacteroidales bacterium]|nr:hypothetical protein [Bacteroidales bacterium]
MLSTKSFIIFSLFLAGILASCRNDKPPVGEAPPPVDILVNDWILREADVSLLQVPLFSPGTQTCFSFDENHTIRIWDQKDEKFKDYYPKGTWHQEGERILIDLEGDDDIEIRIHSISPVELEGTLMIGPKDREKRGDVLLRVQLKPSQVII